MRRAAPCTRPARRNGRNASRISRSPSHSRRIQSALTVVASLARGWSVHHLLQCEELSVLPRKEGTGPQAPARLHRQRRWIVVEGVLGVTSRTVCSLLRVFTTKTPLIFSCSTASVTKSAFLMASAAKTGGPKKSL